MKVYLYDTGLITKEEALTRLKYEKPNNQICIISQQIVDDYLHFVEAIDLGKEEDHG